MIRYATDEDVAIRAPADFIALCPRDQAVAVGSDGLFLADDPWTLRSPSVDFAAAGVGPGQVVQLAGTVFGPQGECFAVDRVGPGGLTVRRKGLGPAKGRPPSTGPGLSGVEFAVRTLAPQVDRACLDLNHRLGIDAEVPGRRPVDLRDPRALAEAAVLLVLSRQYLDLSRQFGGSRDEPGDWYGAKARAARAELDDVLDRLVLRWRGPAGPDPAAPIARFGVRLSR